MRHREFGPELINFRLHVLHVAEQHNIAILSNNKLWLRAWHRFNGSGATVAITSGGRRYYKKPVPLDERLVGVETVAGNRLVEYHELHHILDMIHDPHWQELSLTQREIKATRATLPYASFISINLWCNWLVFKGLLALEQLKVPNQNDRR